MRPSGRWVAPTAWGLIALGVVARCVRYGANRSLWGDEASLAVNLIQRSFRELAAPLDYDQAAPIGFLFLQKAVVLALGDHEYALRLVPLLAGLGSLALFYRIAAALLERHEALIATGLLAISEPLVFYSSELKQYSTDVLVALVILLPASRIAQQGVTPRRLVGLALAGLVGVWFSLPAVFVCGGAGFVLLWKSCLREEGRARYIAATSAVGSLWLGGFAVEYGLLLRPLKHNAYLQLSWADYFAPIPGLEAGALSWYGRVFFAYFNDPVGLPPPELAAFLFAVGFVAMFRRNAIALTLLMSPLALALVASMLGLMPFPVNDYYHLSERYYPFFGRLILFSVPLALPLIARGLGALGAFGTQRFRVLGWLAAALLLALPVKQQFVNIASPPRLQELRSVVEQVQDRIRPRDLIFVQRRAQSSMIYYSRDLKNARGPFQELRGRLPADRFSLVNGIAKMGSGRRFWFFVLHHPHWGSEAEQEAIEAVFADLAIPLHSAEAHNASATLYRTR